MHRVNIVYTGNASSKFIWQHYLGKHLPIACGVSSRHAPIIRCEVERPVELELSAGVENSPSPNETIVAICTVYFSTVETQNDFRCFFASGHPDSSQILADEPNYTQIQPSFNAGHFKASDNTEAPTRYRVKFLFPRQDTPIIPDALDSAVDALVTQLDDIDIDVTGNEIDYCQYDVPHDTASIYECMVGLNVDSQQSLTRIARYIRSTNEQIFSKHIDRNPLVMFSEIINFDLELCEPYLQRSLENPK